MKYTFGTSEAAAERLKDIAEFFNPLAVQFISQHVSGPVECGLDLGCGPGYTTDMLAHALDGQRVYGMDNSIAFLDMARKTFDRYTFIEHDVTAFPFPVRVNVMYARWLLSHLPDVVDLVNGWVGELAAGGTLFIEELEAIDTEIEVFRRYLDINTSLIADEGDDLFVGATLAIGDYRAEILCNEAVTVPVANARAAAWFHPNTVTVWEREEFVFDTVPPAEKKRISRELARLKESRDSRQGIVWTMRRLVLKR